MSLTYEEAATRFARAKDPARGAVLGHATVLEKVGDDYAVRYHATRVVTLHANGDYTLATGGWRAKSTRAVIERYAPVRLLAWRSTWYVNAERQVHVLFTEGLRVTADGGFANALTTSAQAAEEKRIRAYDRLVKRFLDGWAAHVKTTKEFPDPGLGDCMYCAMFDPRGEHPGHLIGHLHEHCFVPRLLWNALVEHCMAADPFTHVAPTRERAGSCAGDRWASSRRAAQRDGKFNGWPRTALRYYLRKRKTRLLEAYGDGSFTQ